MRYVVAASPRAFDLDHLSPEIGEVLDRPGASQDAGKVESTNAGNSARQKSCQRRARREELSGLLPQSYGFKSVRAGPLHGVRVRQFPVTSRSDGPHAERPEEMKKNLTRGKG